MCTFGAFCPREQKMGVCKLVQVVIEWSLMQPVNWTYTITLLQFKVIYGLLGLITDVNHKP